MSERPPMVPVDAQIGQLNGDADVIEASYL
jgi:hypothetical protein